MIGRRGFIGGAIAGAASLLLPAQPKFEIEPSNTIKGVFLVNPNDAFVPEKWAGESLKILETNMVIATLVHRDGVTLEQAMKARGIS